MKLLPVFGSAVGEFIDYGVHMLHLNSSGTPSVGIPLQALFAQPLAYLASWRNYHMPYLWITLYVASILAANLTLDKFIDLGPFGMLSMGTVFFAAVFTLRDRLHSYGLRVVFIAIAAALAVNLAVAVALDTPMRFLLASFVAILISELADTAAYQRMMKYSWLSRALASNAISIPLDSLLFTLIAFYGLMSNTEITQIIWADILFKTLIAGALAVALSRSAQRFDRSMST